MREHHSLARGPSNWKGQSITKAQFETSCIAVRGESIGQGGLKML